MDAIKPTGIPTINNSHLRMVTIFAFGLMCSLVATQAGQYWDRPAVKSYEIEQKVFQLCSHSDLLIGSAQYQQAVELLENAAANDETSYSGYVHQDLGECYRNLHQYPQAIQNFEAALRYDPKSTKSMYTLSLIHYEEEHFDTAAQYLQKLLKETDDSQYIQCGKELMLQIQTYGRAKTAVKEIEAGRMDNAKQLLAEAAKYDPSPVSGSVHASMAFVYRQTGKPELAIEEGKKALQFKPDDKNATYSLAIAYQDIGKFNEAVVWLKKYLTLEDDTQKKARTQELIKDLKADGEKLNDGANNLPDYLDHMVGGAPLKRWAQTSLPIKVHITDGNGVTGFKSKYPSFIDRAFDTWCDASGNRLSYKIVPDSKNADIDVVWISTPIEIEENGRNRQKQGVARVSANNGVIDSVRVEIDTMNGFQPDRTLEDSECASVCMHEIGHSLGLDHSTNYCDIMYFGASSKQTGMPDSRDRATISRLYAGYPVLKKSTAPSIKPAPMKYLPPPAFMPPKPPGDEDFKPPRFLPPPIVDENEKLSPPPFFKPKPIQSENDHSAIQQQIKSPAPPRFIPAPDKKSHASTSAAPAGKPEKPADKKADPIPFFKPPPPK